MTMQVALSRAAATLAQRPQSDSSAAEQITVSWSCNARGGVRLRNCVARIVPGGVQRELALKMCGDGALQANE